MADPVATTVTSAAKAAVSTATVAVQKEETAFNKFVTSIRWPLIAFGAGVILTLIFKAVF